MKKSYEIDMCEGPILGKVLIFTVPLILSGILQLLFNAADVIVVGRFAGSQSLAAVGSTSALINLLINVFMGFSVGVNVLVAQYYGCLLYTSGLALPEPRKEFPPRRWPSYLRWLISTGMTGRAAEAARAAVRPPAWKWNRKA